MVIWMEHMRISALFKRTGFLITKIPNETAHDKEIKPQGMPLGYFTGPTEHNCELEDEQGDEDKENQIEPTMDDNDAVLAEEGQIILHEYREFDEGTSVELEQENELVCHEFLSDDEEVNGDVIDDNEEDVE